MRGPIAAKRPAAGTLALAAGLFFSPAPCLLEEGTLAEITESFENHSALESGWIRVVSGEPAIAIAEVVGSTPYSRLRLGADTVGSDPATVKFVGIRSRNALDSRVPLLITWTLDWNDQENGSYLSAGLILSPDASGNRPTAAADWLRVSYVGVPPGRNARLEVSGRFHGSMKSLYSEGWPKESRLGRKIGLQKLELLIFATGLEIKENGERVFAAKHLIEFPQIYLNLFLTSHSNYKLREVFFDDVSAGTEKSP